MQEITIKQLLKLNNPQLIDIREQSERNEWHIKESIHIPRWELIWRLDELDINKRVYLICATGNRSDFMCLLLDMEWYNAINVIWGIELFNKIKKW